MDNNLKQIKKEVQNLLSTLSCERRASTEGETAIRNSEVKILDNNLKQIKKEVQNLLSTLSCERRASTEGETAIRNSWYQRNGMQLEQHYISRTVALSFAYEQAKRLEYAIDKMLEEVE